MTSRTLQIHDPSGEAYVIEYDAINVISGLSDPLHYTEVEALTAEALWDVDVYEDDALWANDEKWTSPLLTTDVQ